MESDPAGVHEFASLPDHPGAWNGRQYSDESNYIYQLSSLELQELSDALLKFKALGLDGDLVCPANFPLPTLHRKLASLRLDIHRGKGFALIRGLNPSEYSSTDLTTLYLGIRSYIANVCGRQDEKGNMLVHIVANNASEFTRQHTRHSTSEISFHNEEAGDVISWLTRNAAVSGGECIIASAYAVYNTLASNHQDLVRVLTQPDWVFDRPVLFFQDDGIIINFGRIPLVGNEIHPRPPHLPQITGQQLKALDAIEKVARKAELVIKTRPGDIHFINNLFILHRRNAFENNSQSSECRHLVRMRLRDDSLYHELPSQLEKEWSHYFNEALEKVWHIDPMPDGFFPLRSYPN
ncbi:hypothetical protein DER45DRAFT_531381 [Fusarium avenaceum]|nr:hypothetical protein DER45DRAFT_531381 [Fusarium avenaceum]